MNDIRKGSCPLCDHTEILEARPVDSAGGHFVRDDKSAGARGWVISGPNPNHHYGSLTAYICRRCGYLQWFAADPAAIPVSDYYQTRIIEGPEQDGPFR